MDQEIIIIPKIVVVPALIRRFHEAKIENIGEVWVWGSGKPRRELMYVDDMAEASLFIHNLDLSLYRKYTEPMLSHVNIGTGRDETVKDLATVISEVVGFKGEIKFDQNMPDGTQRKLMSSNLLKDLAGLQKWSGRAFSKLS